METQRIYIDTKAQKNGDGTEDNPVSSFAEAENLVPIPMVSSVELVFVSKGKDFSTRDKSDLRCRKCLKLLGVSMTGFAGVEIKCSKCKTINKFETPEVLTLKGWDDDISN
jgi:phage FluMu protein Com